MPAPHLSVQHRGQDHWVGSPSRRWAPGSARSRPSTARLVGELAGNAGTAWDRDVAGEARWGAWAPSSLCSSLPPEGLAGLEPGSGSDAPASAVLHQVLPTCWNKHGLVAMVITLALSEGTGSAATVNRKLGGAAAAQPPRGHQPSNQRCSLSGRKHAWRPLPTLF